MIVQVKLFAAARQRTGSAVISVELGDPPTVARLRDAIRHQFPELAEILRATLFAINQEYGDDLTVIPAGAEVACIPPVSGG